MKTAVVLANVAFMANDNTQVDEVVEDQVEQTEPDTTTDQSATQVDESPWYAGANKLLDEAFGEGGADESSYKEMLSKMTADDLRQLPPVAQAALRAARLATTDERKKLDTDRTAFTTESTQSRAQLEAEKTKAVREHAALMAIFDSPEVKALKNAKIPDNVDLSTEAGKKAFLDASAKVAAAEAFAPIIQRSEDVQRQAAYLALREKYPEMKTPAYEQRVVAKLKERNNAGIATDTETAILLLQGEDIRAQSEQRRATEAKARAEGARVAGRSTAATGQRAAPTLPKEAVVNGKIGEWVRNNLEAARQITGR